MGGVVNTSEGTHKIAAATVRIACFALRTFLSNSGVAYSFQPQLRVVDGIYNASDHVDAINKRIPQLKQCLNDIRVPVSTSVKRRSFIRLGVRKILHYYEVLIRTDRQTSDSFPSLDFNAGFLVSNNLLVNI